LRGGLTTNEKSGAILKIREAEVRVEAVAGTLWRTPCALERTTVGHL
jgi:hypothetical protein